jgi:2-phospho-L-lactate guanylyltransferase
VRTAAILPVKRFALAKQRLSSSAPAAVRLELARAMVLDVLRALALVAAIERTIVITDEPEIAAAARRHGATVLADTAAAGQSAAVALGIERARADGFERVLCVPGDCPALDPGDVQGLLLTEPHRPEVVIVPDRHGAGTNGLLLAPPDVIDPSFGPDSCERHRSLANACGARCRLEHPPSLLLDIDTGEDLAVLRKQLKTHGLGAHGGEHLGRATHTRAVLGLPASLAAAATGGS